MPNAQAKSDPQRHLNRWVGVGWFWALLLAWICGKFFVGPPRGWGDPWLFKLCIALPQVAGAAGIGMTWQVKSPECRLPLRLSLGISLLAPLVFHLPFFLVGFGLPLPIALATLLVCWALPAWLAAADAGYKLRLADEPPHLARLCIGVLAGEILAVSWALLEAVADVMPVVPDEY